MLHDYEREIARVLVEALVEYGLNDHLRQYGVDSAENWFADCGLALLDFWATNGATKICIGHSDLENWVIKVSFKEHVSQDYAALECVNYKFAVEEGLSYYFPETEILGFFGGVAYYVQRKVECDEVQVSSDWYERLRDTYEEDEEEYDEEDLWSQIEDMDDDEKAFLSFRDSKLCEFLRRYNITDLHEGNFGYIGDHMVICDYSGYAG